MKVALQYLNDVKGKTHAVQLPIQEWDRVLSTIKKYEQALKLRTELKQAFEQVEKLKKSKAPKQTLKAFLNEL